MTLFLTSSPTGPLDRSRLVEGLDPKNGFIASLKRRWRVGSRCLMITAAPDEFERSDEMCAHMYHAFNVSGLVCSCVDVWDHRTENFSLEVLYTYDVIILGGGHVPTQNEFFRSIGLREKIARYPGIVIGISAGTMNCAEWVYAQPELEGESVDPNYSRVLPGLALTQINVLPHYQMVKDFMLDGKRLFEDITYPDSMGNCFYALVDGSYIISCGGIEMIYGEAYRIADGEIQKICDEGWTYTL